MRRAVSMAKAHLEAAGEGRYRLVGEVLFANVSGLRQQSLSLFTRGDLELDLAGVERADSAALALLLEWMRLGRGSGYTIRYRNLPEQLLAIARASDLEEVLPLA